MVVGGEQAAGLYHGVGNCSAHLFEHQPLDRTELCAVQPKDARVLDAIAGHQGMMHGVLPVVLLSPKIIARTYQACAERLVRRGAQTRALSSSARAAQYASLLRPTAIPYAAFSA